LHVGRGRDAWFSASFCRAANGVPISDGVSASKIVTLETELKETQAKCIALEQKAGDLQKGINILLLLALKNMQTMLTALSLHR